MSRDYCVTAGWPFLNAVAVIKGGGNSDVRGERDGGVASDANSQIVVVISNEASLASSLRIIDSTNRVETDIDVPARSIQTVIVSH